MFRRSALRALRAAPQACAQEWCVRPPARRLPPPASTLRRLIPARPAASPLAARPPARGLSSDSQPLREASSTLAELTEDDVGAFYTFSREDEAALLPEGCPALSAEFEAQGGRRLLVRDSLLRARARLQPPGPSLPPAPLVLEGLPGSGKSLLLAQLVAGWRQAGGLALYVPRGRDYTIDSNFYAREGAQPAAWDTPEHAGKLLRSLAAAHGGELERMPQRRAGAAAGAPLAALVAAGTAPGAPPATAVDAALAMLAELRLVPRGEEGQPAVLIAVDELNALSSWTEFHTVTGPRSRRRLHAGELRVAAALRSLTGGGGAALLGACSGSAGVSPRLQLADCPPEARRAVPRFQLAEARAMTELYALSGAAGGAGWELEEAARRVLALSAGSGTELRRVLPHFG